MLKPITSILISKPDLSFYLKVQTISGNSYFWDFLCLKTRVRFRYSLSTMVFFVRYTASLWYF